MSGVPAKVSWYHRRLAQGRCRCGRQLAAGRSRCPACLRQMRQSAKERYLRYIAQGRCRRCPQPPAPGKVHCPPHAEEAREAMKKATAALVKRRRAASRCVSCGRPSSTYNCARCRKKIAKRTKKPPP